MFCVFSYLAPTMTQVTGLPESWIPFGLVAFGVGSIIGTLGGGWMYHRWSSVRTLVLFIALTTLSLLAFFAIGVAGLRSGAATIAATVALLVSVSGVIATMIPYAAEIYPVQLRGTGSGVIAASSKFGGILGAAVGVAGLFEYFELSALLIALPMAASALMLLRSGIETRGQRLEDIQDALARHERQ